MNILTTLLSIVVLLTSCQKKNGSSATDTAGATSIPGASAVLDQSSSSSSSQSSVTSDADTMDCQAAADGLAISELIGTNPDPDHVTTDLLLPDLRSDILVTWTTGHTAITSAGKVTRPGSQAADATGSVEAAFTKGGARVVRAYAFTVLRQEASDSESVSLDKLALTTAAVLGTNSSASRITANLTLPNSGAHGTTITWSSTNSAISAAGIVTRPLYTSSTTTVSGNVVATITKNQTSDSVTFPTEVLRNIAPLLITEVYAGTYVDDGWIEVLNTTSAAIDLSQYGWRSCDAATCGTPSSGTFPAVTVAAGHYILLHPEVSFATVNGSQDVFLTGFELYYLHHFFEITKAGATVDFVRWASNSSISTNPTSGTFTGTASMTSGLPGKSLARPYPHDDTDNASDWIFVEKATPGGPNGTGAAAGTDSDSDGLTDDYELNVSHTDPHNVDTDGDGFSDGQEILDNGVAGVSLKALGADPKVRDIFMELDYMAQPAGITNNLYDSTSSAYSLRLRKAALDRVTAVFDAYVPPAGGFPIKIHFDAGHLFNSGGGISLANYDLGGGNEIPFERCLSLGRDGAHTVANCADLYEIKQQNFDSARRYIFHYFIIGWSQQSNGSSGSSGLAELFGNDGIITIGSWGYNSGLETAVVNFQASTILHELGHNLGLQHGGDESRNYKPNYVSSMNYTYQLQGLDLDGNGDIFYRQFTGSPSPLQTHPLRGNADIDMNSTNFVLDYSHGTHLTLNEQSLNETIGWNNVAIDFSFDSAKTGTAVQANIQPATYNSSNTDVLHDYDDWTNLDLKFQEQISAELNGVGSIAWLTDNNDQDKQLLSTPCLEKPFE